MADEDGVDCGYSSDDAGEMPAPAELTRHGGILDLPDDETTHAILAIGGRAVARGSSVAEIGSGQGVLWTVGEEFGLEVLEEPFVFYQLESSALRLEHLAL